jgi:hypothetical protein
MFPEDTYGDVLLGVHRMLMAGGDGTGGRRGPKFQMLFHVFLGGFGVSVLVGIWAVVRV